MEWIRRQRDRQDLLQWRLGRIAFHQVCKKCGQELSRAHALECSNVGADLKRLFPDVENKQICTIIDAVMNKFSLKKDSSIWKILAEAVRRIREACLYLYCLWI